MVKSKSLFHIVGLGPVFTIECVRDLGLTKPDDHFPFWLLVTFDFWSLLTFGHFWPLLKQKVFFEATRAEAKIISNHLNQGKLVQILSTHCTYVIWFTFCKIGSAVYSTKIVVAFFRTREKKSDLVKSITSPRANLFR